MSPERYRQVKSILHAALELDPAEQAAFIEKACGGDSELKAEALSLLDHDKKSAEFLEKPAVEATGPAVRLPAGTRLGPYEIVEPIGAGAMGEVYRARDPRFGRDVAIKLLPAAFANDEGRLARFEREARAAGSLNHPNILTVHDFGREAGAPYLVSELLRGGTLRELLEKSAIAPAKAVEYAAQIARGLGAAHALGIVHRDLKPENLFVVRGGAVKILDFGLAKMPEAPATAGGSAASGRTEPGIVVGSPGYLSPEQIRAEPAGQRSDIFSLGVILYEMLTGKRPFVGETWVDDLNAILRQEAPDLPPGMAGILDPAALSRVVKRCLAKQPEERFESARDLAFVLESLLETPARQAPPSRTRRVVLEIAAAVLLAAAVFFAAFRHRPAPQTVFQRLTFGRGIVSAARFTSDGNTIVYSAAWNGDPSFSVYSTRTDSAESHPLEHENAMLFAVSVHGLALCIPPMGRTQHGVIGTLARTPLGGSGEQTLAMDVAAADWFPDGGLAVVRVENGQSRIEHPIQNVLYTSTGYIDALRVSPAGDAIAFLDHPLPDDSAGSVAIVDLAGHARTISPRYNSMRGLAWSRDGREVWFAAAERGTNMGVWAASLRAGRSPQLIRTFSDYVSVEDLSENGRALLSLHALSESMIHVGPAGESKDLYWHDQSQVRDISVDGRILFSESGDATQRDYEAYVRNASGAPDPLRLGVGLPLSLSPDGQWVIANPASSPAPLTLLPTGAGEKKSLAADDIDHIGAAWLPGGKSFVFAGAPRGEKLRYYVQSLDGGAPRPITGADIHYERRSPIVVSPGGDSVAAVRNDGSVLIYPTEGGEPQAAPGLAPGSGFTPLQWCGDGRLVLHQYDGPTPVLWKVDIKTGEREPWKELSPPNLVGLLDITPIRVSPDCQSYAYSPLNVLSQVSLATGLR